MDDLISRQAVLDIVKFEENWLSDAKSNNADTDIAFSGIRTQVAKLSPVTPERIETVTEFADRCRECGKTAITRAENDEILNEAWRLLMNVTEGDGVSTEQANGMLKLMTFFFYKYHGLKKKPEWAENVEARIEESEDKE